MKKTLILSLALVSFMACTKNENPLLTQQNTPYGVPAFDKVKNEHYLPAFEKAIAENKAEIDAINLTIEENCKEIERCDVSIKTSDEKIKSFNEEKENLLSVPSTLGNPLLLPCGNNSFGTSFGLLFWWGWSQNLPSSFGSSPKFILFGRIMRPNIIQRPMARCITFCPGINTY